ncbi:MAG: ATP-binding cassette domain-containing protein [Acidobacteria bacterium]|nr:ATP-binding cassette domain-containing protein [Acidobacteriota bacterium]
MTHLTAAPPVISYERIRIGFGEGDVLRDVSFSVAAKETKVLVGETGTGKTLLLKMAAGLLKPSAGRVFVLGSDVSGMKETKLLDFRRQLGVVFQEGALFDSLSVAENVAFRLTEEGVEAEEIETRVREALRFVEMEHAIEKLPGELSGGMRRRVSIARALITKPPIVLYDSPTAGLDPVTAQTIIHLILRLRDTIGVTALLATHRLQDAFGLASFRYDSDAGRVVPIDKNPTNGAGHAATSFLFLRDGGVHFEGNQGEVLESQDVYIKGFLV